VFGWTCFSVTGFSLAFGVTVPAWPRLSGYVEGSQVTDDLNGAGVAEARHSDVLPMLFFRLKEHAVLQAQHRSEYPQRRHCRDYS
jgi:hypothetical protein